MDYIFERGKFTESELEAAIIELFKKEFYKDKAVLWYEVIENNVKVDPSLYLNLENK